MDDDLYARLSSRFEQTFTDRRGGVDITYVSGEQVVSRLNTELGFQNWSFRVVEHGTREDADEIWVLGELTVFTDTRTIVRQQFGSDKIQRSRQTGTPLDIGFDYKSATTDALKKCASLIGVALYLSVPTNARQSPPPALICQEPGCNQRLTAHQFTDGTSWSVQELVKRAEPYGKVYCFDHLRKAAA